MSEGASSEATSAASSSADIMNVSSNQPARNARRTWKFWVKAAAITLLAPVSTALIVVIAWLNTTGVVDPDRDGWGALYHDVEVSGPSDWRSGELLNCESAAPESELHGSLGSQYWVVTGGPKVLSCTRANPGSTTSSPFVQELRVKFWGELDGDLGYS